MSIKKLTEEISELEKKVREHYPKQKGRVLLANAKTNVDYELGKDAHEMQWCMHYRDELLQILK